MGERNLLALIRSIWLLYLSRACW